MRVNHFTGETRVDRMLGAFGFGRVLNAKTARSQCLGGITWSIGTALTEALEFEPIFHVPVAPLLCVKMGLGLDRCLYTTY